MCDRDTTGSIGEISAGKMASLREGLSCWRNSNGLRGLFSGVAIIKTERNSLRIDVPRTIAKTSMAVELEPLLVIVLIFPAWTPV